MVFNHFTAVRHQGLRPVAGEHVQPAAAEDLLHNGQLSSVLHESGASGELGQNAFRDIILRGTETACSKDDIIDGQFVAEVVQDFVAVVPDGQHAGDTDAGLFERDGKAGRVGVHNLADEDFIADGADGSLDHAFGIGWSMALRRLLAVRRGLPGMPWATSIREAPA